MEEKVVLTDLRFSTAAFREELTTLKRKGVIDSFEVVDGRYARVILGPGVNIVQLRRKLQPYKKVQVLIPRDDT